MSVIFADSFDYYTSLATKWTDGAGDGVIDLTGTKSRTGIGCCGMGFNGPKVPLPNMTNVIVGAAVNPLANLPCPLFQFWHGGAPATVQIGIDTDLSVTFWVWQVGQGGKSAPGVCVANGYNYIEAQLILGLTTGSVTIRVNGVLVFQALNVNTVGQGGGPYDAFQLYCDASGGYVDDVYVVNPAVSPNNSFLGAIRIYAEVPYNDSTPLQFTPSTPGAHYPLVNSVPPNLSDWVESNTVGQQDQYLHPTTGIPATVAVLALQHNLLAELDSAGSRSIASCVNGIVDANAYALSTSETQVVTPYDLDPVTGAPWLLSNIPLLREFGPAVTA